MELYDYINQSLPKTNLPPITPPNFNGREYKDGYPELTADSRLWIELFMITDSPNHQLSDQLMIIRRTGAILVQDPQYGFAINIVIDPTGQRGWESQQQYDQERQYLVPYGNQLISTLAELRRRYDQKTIIW